MEIKKVIEILKNRHEYIVPNSDFDEAMIEAISLLEEKRILEEVNSKVNKDDIIEWFNDSIKTDKLIDEFLRKNEGKNMRKFEYVERIKEKTFELPKRSTKNSMAYDIYSPIDFEVKPKETYMLKTGIKAQMGENEGLILNVRSSMGKKHIMLANTNGWIDSDYYNNADNEGEIGVLFYNYGEETWEVKAGDRVAQCMFINFLTIENDNTTATREGGWGSTNG